MTSMTQSREILIVCDFQPDVAQKIPSPRLWVDLVTLAIQAARLSHVVIVYTQLRFERSELEQIPVTHPRLGILRKLAATVTWFTSGDLCVVPQNGETIVRRTTFLPHSTDATLLNILQNGGYQKFTLLGYGPTVQAMCHILGDLIAATCIQLIREGIQDENSGRRTALLEHGCMFNEQVISMVDYLESLDVLHKPVPTPTTLVSKPPLVKYVCDVGRGGHLSLFMHYLVRDYGYVPWPTQPWYQEQKLLQPKQFFCPLGRHIVELCDEPQFGSGTRFFLIGRKYLDEKDHLYALVPELMPPTFATIEEAEAYDHKSLWFLKKVNQNGGRAVKVLTILPTSLEPDDQLQAHVPRPLLWGGNIKCHVKTYQWIGCFQQVDRIEWQLYQHDLFWLATADKEWSVNDTSDEAQITTMRTHRLYRDHAWRIQWNLTELCQTHIQTVLKRVIEQGKLQIDASRTLSKDTRQALQFEIHSADWMLDQDGRVYLIECNGIPVLYDPGQKQPLVTRGLQLYDRLYQEDPVGAIVNDHELMKDAVQLAMKGSLPKESLWKHLMTVPVVTKV